MSRRGHESPFDSDGRLGAVDERIADWVDGRLDEIQLQRFEAELRVNPALRAAAEEYRRSVQAIREALAGGERVRAGFADRVMTAIEGERRQRGRRWIPWLGSAAAAAALVGLWLALSRGVILPDSRRELARAPAASPSADGAPAPQEATPKRLDESADAPAGGGLEILPGAFLEEESARDRIAGLAQESAEREAGTVTRSPDAEDERKDGSKDERAERAFAGGERRARSAERKPGDATEEPRAAPGTPVTDAQRGFRDDPAAENEDLRRQAESPAPSSGAALDAGQLVYLVEIPVAALDQLSTVGGDAKLISERLGERERAAALPPATSVQALAPAQALAAYRLAIEPLQSPSTWTANVTMPQLFALDLASEAAETPPAGTQDSGRYAFMPGDLVFEIGGDEAQVQDYLRQLAKPLREVAGSIAVQRAVDVVARERIAVPTDPARQSAADELFLGFFARSAAPVEESFAEATRRFEDRGDQPLGRPGRGAAPKAARTGPSSPGPGGPPTPPSEPVAPSTAVQPTGGARVQNSWVVLRAKPSAPASEAGPAQRR